MNIYNLIILDESGSMYSIERQAINAMNETIQTVKAAQEKHPEQKQFVSLISFSGSGMEGVKVIRDRVPATEVKEISSEDYRPNSCTPLYDAMGFGITTLDKAVTKEDVVLVTIITDGEENTSKVYSGSAIKELVAGQRKKGWTFAYIGANQDSVEVARELNIKNALNFDASALGVSVMAYKFRSSAEKLYECCLSNPKEACDRDDFFSEG